METYYLLINRSTKDEVSILDIESLFIAICEMGIIMCDTALPYKDVVKVKGIALINLGLCR